MTDPAIVDARAVTRTFGDVSAVRGLTFAVQRGEVVGLLGHNGAGKSTTMRLLAGVLTPSSGVVLIDGHAATSVAARARTGFAPETPALTPELTVEEQLAFAAGLRSLDAAAVGHVIASCGLVDVRRRLNATLSKGTKQRVGLAQALLGDPPVLLLDEPTAGLDPQQAASTRALVRGLAPDHAVVLSTHLLHEVAALCSRVIVLKAGALVLDTSVAALRTRAPSVEQALLAALEIGPGVGVGIDVGSGAP